MLLILDGSSDLGANVRSNLCYMISLRPSFRWRVVTNWFFGFNELWHYQILDFFLNTRFPSHWRNLFKPTIKFRYPDTACRGNINQEKKITFSVARGWTSLICSTDNVVLILLPNETKCRLRLNRAVAVNFGCQQGLKSPLSRVGKKLGFSEEKKPHPPGFFSLYGFWFFWGLWDFF